MHFPDRPEEATESYHNNSPCCAPGGNQQDLRKPVLDKVEKSWKHFSKSGMIDLSGGKFLMGTDYPEGFPKDGEGPVRQIKLDSFFIDSVASQLISAAELIFNAFGCIFIL